MSRWTWACASNIGTSHVRTGQRLQDAFSCFALDASGGQFFVALVADGAGSATYGGEGAAVVCRTIGLALRAHFTRTAVLPQQGDFETWVDEARDRIYQAAKLRDKDPRDFASTLVCAVSNGSESVFAHVGDGCAVVRNVAGAEWVAPTWPEQGEYASMTSFVTDQPVAKLRVSVHIPPIDALCVFSDGIERMVLDTVQRKPFERFFNVMAKPIFDSQLAEGKDAQLSQQLAEYLGSEGVTSRTDDDKTLVIAALR